MKHKSNLILGGTLVAGLAVTLAAHAAVLTSALVGRWICNEGSGINALDSSTMGNTGVLAGSASFITK